RSHATASRRLGMSAPGPATSARATTSSAARTSIAETTAGCSWSKARSERLAFLGTAVRARLVGPALGLERRPLHHVHPAAIGSTSGRAEHAALSFGHSVRARTVV